MLERLDLPVYANSYFFSFLLHFFIRVSVQCFLSMVYRLLGEVYSVLKVMKIVCHKTITKLTKAAKNATGIDIIRYSSTFFSKTTFSHSVWVDTAILLDVSYLEQSPFLILRLGSWWAKNSKKALLYLLICRCPSSFFSKATAFILPSRSASKLFFYKNGFLCENQLLFFRSNISSFLRLFDGKILQCCCSAGRSFFEIRCNSADTAVNRLRTADAPLRRNSVENWGWPPLFF